MMITTHVPIGLTIAGSDSGGGAGIQADLKAFSALGVFGASVITAVTAQNTHAVTAVHEIPNGIITAQIDAVFDDLKVDAVKIGMLATSGIINIVVDSLKGRKVPIVLDPVMIAKSGHVLLKTEAMETLRKRLLPLATLLTPNLPEAGLLLGTKEATTLKQMEEQGRSLLAMGPKAVLMKGGHAEGSDCADLLIMADGSLLELHALRIDTKNTHGTGCTLSASIAAGLAKNLPLDESMREAHSYLQGAIAAADGMGVGSGNGPVHHFYRHWN